MDRHGAPDESDDASATAASAALGMVVEHDDSAARWSRCVVRDDMTNGFHITHGGLVFALADTGVRDRAATRTSASRSPQGADITFLKSTTTGQTLTATAVRRAPERALGTRTT